MKRWSVWILFVLSLLFAWWTFSSIEYEIKEQNLTEQLKQKVTLDYFDTHINHAIKTENFDDVEMYQSLANMLGIGLSAKIESLIASHNGFLEKSWRNTKAFGSGFLSGESNTTLGLSGSIVSDMTLYGDLRDLKKEGSNYIDDKPYDKFILSISLVGVGLSASQLVSIGASTPLKVGASVLKVAKKSGTLTKAFTKVLLKRLDKSVDVKQLKTLEFKNIFKIKDTMRIVQNSIDIKPLQILLKDVNQVKAHTSLTDTILLMKYVDTPKGLQKLTKVSRQYKTNTKGVMRVLGKGALRAGKSVVKFTSRFMMFLTSFIFSMLGLLLSLILKIKVWKSMRK